MKKTVCLMMICLLLAGAAALAQEGYIGRMRVINCEEWVSLRAKPDGKAERLIKVPLGATVENCAAENQDFIYAEYEGKRGYILSEYLEKAEAAQKYLGDLRVINCSDYVNMRDGPGTDAKRVARVPVNALVEDCTAAENGFIFGRYKDIQGYISAAYLGSADAALGTNCLTDCRVQMVRRESACGAVLLAGDLGGSWSLKREKSRLEAALSGLPEEWRALAMSVPDENIVEVAQGRELYLIIPADEAAAVSINELTPPENGEPARFKRVIFHAANGRPILLRCNAAEAPWEKESFQADTVYPYDCEVNLVDSGGNGMTWYPYLKASGGEMNTQTFGASLMNLTECFGG